MYLQYLFKLSFSLQVSEEPAKQREDCPEENALPLLKTVLGVHPASWEPVGEVLASIFQFTMRSNTDIRYLW